MNEAAFTTGQRVIVNMGDGNEDTGTVADVRYSDYYAQYVYRIVVKAALSAFTGNAEDTETHTIDLGWHDASLLTEDAEE